MCLCVNWDREGFWLRGGLGCWAALLPTKSSCQPSEKMSYLGGRPRTVSWLDNAASHGRRDRPNKDTSHLSTYCKRQTDVSDLHCNWNWATAPVFMHSLEEESWEVAAVAQFQNWLNWNETAHAFPMLVASYCTKNANKAMLSGQQIYAYTISMWTLNWTADKDKNCILLLALKHSDNGGQQFSYQ